MAGLIGVDHRADSDEGAMRHRGPAGGVVATAVTFFLLVLGSGFGLLLVSPLRHAGPSVPAFRYAKRSNTGNSSRKLGAIAGSDIRA